MPSCSSGLRTAVRKAWPGTGRRRSSRRPELEAGLGIMDVLRDVYENERRFELRDERPAYLVERQPGTGLVEALFGLYPGDEPSTYIASGYGDVFKPTVVEATPDIWTKVYMEGGVSPLGLTAHRLERQPTGWDDPKYFVFDPSKATDLIDLWNMRSEPGPVLPVPMEWWPALAGEISTHVAAAHRPLRGNPHGVMHRITVEFARSIAEERQQHCIAMLDPGLPPGSLVRKPWRTRVWERYRGERVGPPRPVRVDGWWSRFSDDRIRHSLARLRIAVRRPTGPVGQRRQPRVIRSRRHRHGPAPERHESGMASLESSP